MSDEDYQNHLNYIKYFWEEKGDIERYVSFEEVLLEIQKRNPELLKVWNDYKVSIRMMDIIVKSL